MTKYIDSIEFATELCCECGIAFAFTADFQRRRVDDHEFFYCPAGHKQHYTGQTEAMKLRTELERNMQMLEAEQARAAKALQERDEVTRAHQRMRVRIQNGVCPCCNRTFQNLLQHMQTEHAALPTLKVLREAYGLTQAALANEVGVSPYHVSLREHERPVPAYAEKALNSWVTRQSTKAKP